MTPKRRLLLGIPPGQWLTVFAIIALMYAILYPVFQHVREHGGPSCMSNMRGLGLALAQYEQNCGSFPPGKMLPEMAGRASFTRTSSPSASIAARMTRTTARLSPTPRTETSFG